ncbi:MAG: DNA alkylation repair protein [Patescibacteria group bacterium]|jgi:3-methyladenine DNA glycosylase AlkD
MTLADIRRELTLRGDPKKCEPIRYYFNHTKLRMYGASTPAQRSIARQWTREHQQASAREVLSLVNALYCAPSFDERLIASYVLAQNVRVIPSITEAQWNRWIARIDNWAVSDNICGVPLGTWVLADPARGEHYLKKLIASKNIWARRVAIVALTWVVRYNKSPRWKNLAFSFVRKTMHERDVIMTKAVSWILRALIHYHAPAVRTFVEKYENDLPAIARRETLNKLKSGKKSGK